MKHPELIFLLLRKTSFICLLQLLVISLSLSGVALAGTRSDYSSIPAVDTVTMIDLGAKTCIPCKMMAPILSELQGEYQGRAAIIFIDVREDPSQGKRFDIHSIPTQIFYDKVGKEVYRHVGFLSKKEIKTKLDMLILKK